MRKKEDITRFYSLRFSLLPTLDFNERMEKLLDFCEKALIDDVMFFISPEEVNVGHITIEEAKEYVDVIKRAKDILAEKGIKISLNPWCTLSHWDGGRKLKEGQNFRTMVGHDGTVAERVACPLCQNWRDYYVELINFYADALGPEIMWIEDDMRCSNHDPVWLGCFCEEHMARFNGALGTNYDRQTFIDKIFTDQRVRKVYLDVVGESIRETLEYITTRIKNKKSFGLMTGGIGQAEGRKSREIYRALKGGEKYEKPYNRVCLHSYRQLGLPAYAWKINEGSMLSCRATGEKAYCVSEIESFPHTMYTKSVNYTRYQLLSTAPMGLKGDTFSIFEFNGNGVVNYDKMAKMLCDVKPYLNRVVKLDFRPEEMCGVHVLFSENSSYNIKCKNHSFGELNPYDGWIYAYLSQLGIACRYSNDASVVGRIVAMSGQTVRNYTERQLEHIFKNNFVILTGDNVEALFDLGLNHLIGAESFEIMTELDGKHSFEQINSDEEIHGVKNMRATAQFFCGSFYNIKYSDESRKVLSKMYNYDQTPVGDAITQVGNVLIFPYANTHSDQQVPISLLHPMREFVIKQALLSNPYGVSDLYMVDEENVCMYVFDREEKTYIVCMNFSDDYQDRLHLDAPYIFENMKFFTPDNDNVRQGSFVYEDGRYRVNNSLKAQESYVLICYKGKEKIK